MIFDSIKSLFNTVYFEIFNLYKNFNQIYLKSLLPRGLDQSEEDIADVFEVEFQQTSREVEQARDRFERMLEEARMRDEGVKLDVNERYLLHFV